MEYAGRTYVVSTPQACARGDCGLIVDLHGTSMNPDMQESVTRLRALGASAVDLGASTAYVVIQPEAAGHPARWSKEDPEIIYEGIRCIARRMRLDPKRWPLGAYVSAHIACAHPRVFASHGLIAGGADILAGCLGDLGPTLYIHGVEDAIIPFAMAQRLADAAQRSSREGRVESLSVQRTRYVAHDLWLETIFHNGRSPVVGAHCVPGGSGPVGCDPGFDAGTELLRFYVSHTQR